LVIVFSIIVTTAPSKQPKPSAQTQLLLEHMADKELVEEQRWGDLLEHLDLLSKRLNDVGITQQELKQQLSDTNQKVDQCSAQQRLIAKQVQANGQAVAQLTVRQFENDHSSVSDGSVIANEEDHRFENVFADRGKAQMQTGPSHHPTQPRSTQRSESIPRHALPKLLFPTSDGSQPKVWLDKCLNYFHIYQLPESLWVDTASMHLQENAAKWWQTYKLQHSNVTWSTFSAALQTTFGPDDHWYALNELMDLKQTDTVEDYTTRFKSLQFDVTLHGCSYDDMFFATHYIRGLREDIRAVVEPQRPTTVETAMVIAKIQQKVIERSKVKSQLRPPNSRTQQPKLEAKPPSIYGNLWRDKQLRDYRKANNLCYGCGEKYEPGHAEVCTKRNKPHLNALVVNDLDREIPEELLNEMAVDEMLTETFGQLSLNAIAGTEGANSLQLKATVKNKTMLILVDTGSSHSFVSSQFVHMAQLSTVPMPRQQIRLADGSCMSTTHQVKDLQWYIQGSTFTKDMIVLDKLPYDAILGFDWLQQFSPMQCDWGAKTLQFHHEGKWVTLHGLSKSPVTLTSMSAKQMFKSIHGNDVWAYVLVDRPTLVTPPATSPETPEAVKDLLLQYADIFQAPTKLPPHRAYDHAIPLYPDAVPVNARPYHYSPQHKTEIENQVKQLLEAGLITHSHSPFASPVLLVKKKDGQWRFCVDYRKLNALTVKNRFPMPIVEEILDELAGSKLFTKLDMRSGYHQIRMLPQDEDKTAFKTHQGHYQFRVMPFGLTNAPATFQCIMNQILQPYLRKFVLVFLDDILIYSKTMEDHLDHIQQVFEMKY